MANTIILKLRHEGKDKSLTLPDDATLQDLSETIATQLDVPTTRQKLLISPSPGLLRPPFEDPSLQLTSLLQGSGTRSITLLGASNATKSDLDEAVATHAASVSARHASRAAGAKVSVYKHVDSRRIQDEAKYTFHALKPLPYLQEPKKSLAFLERLARDPGIKKAMVAHEFSVGLLTEMDPAEHTTHSGRTLGLNRNRGEVIELRLRTDAYDGYRDYKTIRKTLCHELAHNVFGEHDQKFWRLCTSIEDEVLRNDFGSGGRAVGNEEYASAPDNLEHVDHGGWTGGEYVLGSASNASNVALANNSSLVNRRDVLARAADARQNKDEPEQSADKPRRNGQ